MIAASNATLPYMFPHDYDVDVLVTSTHQPVSHQTPTARTPPPTGPLPRCPPPSARTLRLASLGAGDDEPTWPRALGAHTQSPHCGCPCHSDTHAHHVMRCCGTPSATEALRDSSAAIDALLTDSAWTLRDLVPDTIEVDALDESSWLIAEILERSVAAGETRVGHRGK